MRARINNATEARHAVEAVDRALVVTGDEPSQRYWAATLGRRPLTASTCRRGAAVIAERGRKGNFLGALQAHQRVERGEVSVDHAAAFDQIVMLVGSGTRLSPITQSLRNMKAALPLPSGDGSELTVGEAAVRSTAPWIRTLKEGNFDGVVVRWGDEIIIPSAVLGSQPCAYADVDAVRFGYRVTPTELLAAQKEWLISDENLTVHAELPRQSLQRLMERVSEIPGAHSFHVNLGSFGATHQLLASLTYAFQVQMDEAATAANWDPYLWMALHHSDEEAWEAACCAEPGVRSPDFVALRASIPDFWRRAQLAKEHLRSKTGRPLTAKVLDFGDPYWFDAGNHMSLRAGLRDIFQPGLSGDTIRAFFALPESICRGESHIANSRIAAGTSVQNSIIINSSIDDAESSISGAIVVSSQLGRLQCSPGAAVFECSSSRLTVDGPEGLAFRISEKGDVAGTEVAAGVGFPSNLLRLSVSDELRMVDDTIYNARLPNNSISFREAAETAEQFDPLDLRDHWRHPRSTE